jgi:predicted house-cleaning NTP pyrophosphatase (Maf/HAM1 superfamily)
MSDQKTQAPISKTGQTPVADEDIPGRSVNKVAEVRAALVEYVDNNNPDPITRLVLVLPGDLVVFLDDKILGKKTQSWFAKAVIKKLNTPQAVPASAKP